MIKCHSNLMRYWVTIIKIASFYIFKWVFFPTRMFLKKIYCQSFVTVIRRFNTVTTEIYKWFTVFHKILDKYSLTWNNLKVMLSETSCLNFIGVSRDNEWITGRRKFGQDDCLEMTVQNYMVKNRQILRYISS